MKTRDDLQVEFIDELTDNDENHKRHDASIRRRYAELFEQIEEFGGFLDRNELADYLGVSMPRVSVLIRDGRIRESRHGCSLADATKYRDTRKPGRPPRHPNLNC